MALPCRGRDRGERLKLGRNFRRQLETDRRTHDQGRSIFTIRKLCRLGDERIAIAFDLAMKVRHSGVGGQENRARNFAAGIGIERCKIQQRRKQDHTVERHAITRLKMLRETCHTHAAVRLAKQVFRRCPAVMGAHPHAHKIAKRFDVLIEPVKILGLDLIFRAAVAGRNRIDKNQIANIENAQRIFRNTKGRGSRAGAVTFEVHNPWPQHANVQPYGR